MRRFPEPFIWVVLAGSLAALLFPDLFANYLNRNGVRLFAAALFVASAAVLTDKHYHWLAGLT